MNKEIKYKLDKWVSKEYEWLRSEMSRNITKQQMSQYTDDLLHTVLSDLYKQPDFQLEQMINNGKLGHWCLRAASLQIRSKTSPFYYQFRKHKLSVRSGIIDSNSGNPYDQDTYEIREDVYTPDEDLMDCFDRAKSQLHWYLQTIFNKKFIEEQSLQQIWEYYGITKTHLVKDLNQALAEIRETCKDVKQ